MVTNLELKNYLLSLTATDTGCGKFYTQTDVIELTVQTEREREARKIPEQKKPESFPVLTGIRKYVFDPKVRHVLLSGRPGSGKSMSLRRLLLEEAERSLLLLEEVERSLQGSGIIPVLVELRSRQPILKLIESAFRQHRLRLSAEQIDDLLFEGKLLLLLDGVNEIPTNELMAELEGFRSNNLTTPMIFTTRDLGMGGDLRIEKKMQMEPLKSEQMRQFVGKYLPGEPGAELLRQLGDRLKELGETPLLLKLLCDVFELRQKIPKNKGELFQWVDEEYDRLKGMPTLAPELRHWKAELLQQLAFEMMRGNDPTKLNLTILRTDAIAIFESFLQERGVSDFGQKARTLLEDLQKYHLLQPTANQKIEFHHQLFQEYYAAEYLLRRFASWNDGVLQQEYLNYLKWTEPLALMLGLVEDKDQALRVVRSALDVDLKLGARLAGEVKQKFQPHAVSDTMQKFSSDFPKEPSWLKLKLLRQIGKAAIYELIPLLDDPSPSIRYHAYRTLRFIAPEEIPEQCRAREDFNWNPQRLERNPESLEPEEPLIQQDSDSSVSREVTEASHTIDSQAIALGLLKVMMSHPESFVRYEAVLGLGELSRKDDIAKFLSETHLQELVQQLEDSYIYTRWSIALMLWNIASEEVIPLLRPKLDHSNPDIALSAALILGKFGCSAAVPRLVEMMDYSNLSNHPNVQDISYLAGYALGQVKDNVTSEYLPKLLTLVSTQSGADVFQAIASIQDRCKYYNHEIFQSLSEPEESNLPVTRSETSITYEIGQVGIFNAGNVTIEGDQKG